MMLMQKTVQSPSFLLLLLVLLTNQGCDSDSNSNNNNSGTTNSRISYPDIAKSYLLVSTPQGLLAVDPDEPSSQIPITQAETAAVTIPRYTDYNLDYWTASNDYAAYMDNGHLYRIDLKKNTPTSLQPQQVSPVSGIDKLCRLSLSGTNLGDLSRIRLRYAVVGGDGFCGSELDAPPGSRADNLFYYVLLNAGSENIAENQPIPQPVLTLPARTQEEILGIEFRNYVLEHDANNVATGYVLKSRLLLDNGNLLYFVGTDVNNPHTLFQNVTNFQSFYLLGDYLRVDKNFYRFDMLTGQVGDLIYTFVNDVMDLNYMGHGAIGGSRSFAFFDDNKLYKMTDDGVNAPVVLLNGDNFGPDSWFYRKTDNYVVVVDENSNSSIPPLYYRVPKTGGKRQVLNPAGYNPGNGGTIKRIFTNQFLLQSEDHSNYILIDENGSVREDFKSSVVEEVDLFGYYMGLLVNNYHGSKNLVVYDPVNYVVIANLGQLTSDGIFKWPPPSYIRLNNSISAFYYDNHIFLYNNTKPGQSQEILTDIATKTVPYLIYLN